MNLHARFKYRSTMGTNYVEVNHESILTCFSDPRKQRQSNKTSMPLLSFLTSSDSNLYHLQRPKMKLSASLLLASLATSSAFVAQQSPAFRLSATELFERKPFITGNWKLNPQTKAEAVDLARGIASSITDDSPCDVALFVPFPFIDTVQSIVGDKLIVGAEVRKMIRQTTKVSFSCAMLSYGRFEIRRW